MYPNIYREIRRLIRLELLRLPTPRDMARRAGIRQGAATGSLPQVLATFSAANSENGHEMTYGTEDLFPDSAPLTVEADWPSEVRLLANVKVAGDEGSALEWRCPSFAISPTVPLDTTGLVVSSWQPVEPGEAAASLYVLSPAGGAATVGLVQGQGR